LDIPKKQQVKIKQNCTTGQEHFYGPIVDHLYSTTQKYKIYKGSESHNRLKHSIYF